MADKKGDKKGDKKTSPDDIMDPKEMKPILAESKRGRPAACAIALTKDKDGVILLDKRKKPKKLLAELKKQATDLGLELETTTLRFGRAVVDADTDPKLLSLTVNKEAPGAMRPRLLEQIKKAGFSKLEIVVDANLEAEPEEDEPAAAPGAAAAPPSGSAAAPPPGAPAPGATAPDAAATPAAAPQAPSQPAPADASTQATGTGPDAAALTKELTELVRQVVAASAQNPAQAAKLADLAKAAQARLKRGELDQVAAEIKDLRDALAKAGSDGGTAAAAPSGSAPNGADPAMINKLKKSRDVWDATVAKIARDLDQLVKAVTAASAGHELGDGFEREFQTVVKPLLDTVDTTLSDLLSEAAKAGTAEEHQRMLGQARETVGKLTKFVQSHPVVGHLDDNPFVPMSLQKTLSASLTAVSNTLG